MGPIWSVLGGGIAVPVVAVKGDPPSFGVCLREAGRGIGGEKP